MGREADRGNVVEGRIDGDKRGSCGGEPPRRGPPRLRGPGSRIEGGVRGGDAGRRNVAGGDRGGAGGGHGGAGGDRLSGGGLPEERVLAGAEGGETRPPWGGAGLQERQLQRGGRFPVAGRARRENKNRPVGSLARGEGARYRTRRRRLLWRWKKRRQKVDQTFRQGIRRRISFQKMKKKTSYN
ncbi:hypothetical protein DM860_001799 [Cuscuta australis]|uniref:Uncharacterized protein n=1 Tax=Cuscuta australis TaxID=267555 RepID=A0A328EDZ0_9ASTE|nr:hypothetical protein DM860_001799 [Cuscuta australis]